MTCKREGVVESVRESAHEQEEAIHTLVAILS